MSEETQTINAADTPMINLQDQQEEINPVESPIQLHDPEPDEEINAADDDNEPIERPDYYPEKFWDEDGPDVEKLAKSYAELEKAFKAGKHKAPKDGYNMEDLVDRGLDLEDPATQAYQEWAQKYGISQQAFEDLANTILDMSGEQIEAFEYDQREEMQKLGKNAQETIAFVERQLMKANLNNEERDAISYGLNSAAAIKGMAKIIQGFTNENIPTQPVVATPEMTEADLAQAVNDPRWQSDPVWRGKIEQQWMAANS